ncbi:hypothetical protein TNCV_408661 [Trichonephila clavipes]|nr:hypothetical protein TNCV_408661 [Trichonephila clavipes]
MIKFICAFERLKLEPRAVTIGTNNSSNLAIIESKLRDKYGYIVQCSTTVCQNLSNQWLFLNLMALHMIPPASRGLLATNHIILNHGQVMWMTPELAPPSPNYHTTPTGGRFSS